MELIFNELSINPLSNDRYTANEKIIQFIKAVSEARKKGFKYIRSHNFAHEIFLCENYSLQDWINDKTTPKEAREYKDILYGMFIHPFIKDGDESIENQYIDANYYFEDSENDIEKCECLGLAAAYLYETLSISLPSQSIWQKPELPLIIEKEDNVLFASILNISQKESFNNSKISYFVENVGNIVLEETNLLAENKKIHLADHHGKNILNNLCQLLKNSPHVVEMRSTNWGGSNFIRKIYKEGVIEIVLVKSERQYALWVQTTGRNYRETKAIADILKEKYER